MYRQLQSRHAIINNGRINAAGISAVQASRKRLNLRAFTSSQTVNATENHTWRPRTPYKPPFVVEESHVGSNIRQRLRAWEAARSTGEHIHDELADLPQPGENPNEGMRSLPGGYLMDVFRKEIEENDDSRVLSDQGELVDLGDNRPYLLAGDMVELNITAQTQPELAICVQVFDGRAQLYTMSGKWVERTSNTLSFYVPEFVTPDEVKGLLPYLPTGELDPLERNRLMSFQNSAPREIGAPLIDKMMEFWRKTQEVSRDSRGRLDSAYEIVASPDKLQYYTLQELAGKLLGSALKSSDGKYPIYALYAVHRAVLHNSFGFHARGSNQRHSGSRYEVLPIAEKGVVERVAGYVREFYETKASGFPVFSRHDLPLVTFIRKAQHLVDSSRKRRILTEYGHGTLGPCIENAPEPEKPRKFVETDTDILRFLESWAAMLNFESASTAPALGSLILRAIDRYDGYLLDESTAWTLLKEMGIVAPWDNRTAFDLRLPKAGFQLSAEEDIEEHIEVAHDPLEDGMKALRKDWSLPVYCIDDIGAQEIDDGISLETIEGSPNEHWVHIHTADPASHLQISSKIAKNAGRIVGSLYLPERKLSMIPRDITSNLFSLGNGRPSLTFSAKINDAGEILETKVTAGYVHDVKYITPSVVDELENGNSSNELETKTYTVGESTLSERSESGDDGGRRVLKANELTGEDKKTLQKLYTLATARRRKAEERGALPMEASRLIQGPLPRVSVHFDREISPSPDLPKRYDTDPTIELKFNTSKNIRVGAGETLVTNMMLLGGEIASQWCQDRGIPIIYRVSPQNPSLPDPKTYIRETLLPALETSGEAARNKILDYLIRMGRVALSTTPGPHLTIGLPKYTKVTSPLRRYPDLLNHWQIQAALLKEAETGQSLVGSTEEDYLPFSREAIEELIPTIDDKERAIRKAHKEADHAWVLQFILRAWKFKQCDIPQTFECHVSRIVENRTSFQPMLHVRIGFLGIIGKMEAPEWVDAKDLKVGDAFECEFDRVDFYLRNVWLKPLRRIQEVDG